MTEEPYEGMMARAKLMEGQMKLLEKVFDWLVGGLSVVLILTGVLLATFWIIVMFPLGLAVMLMPVFAVVSIIVGIYALTEWWASRNDGKEE